MIIYLSSDRRNTFFIELVEGAVGEFNRTLPEAAELVYPPRGEGDTGFISSNVLRIQEADVVIFDITPSVLEGISIYNPGVMIEYGIFLSLEKPKRGVPWGGKQPKPSHAVFCNGAFPLGNLSPILNEVSVRHYTSESEGEAELADEIRNILRLQATAMLSFANRINASSLTTPQVYTYPFGQVTS